ncbi:hypothetical protein GF351_00580 [Candidatus Woesearchaeota archaeon]|nr:hypothetical protein [Candidatus Woesearchaeota archaeon]
MDENVLMGIGLTRNEAKVYLALVSFGFASAGKLAEKSGVHRANVYDALERLIEKGVVSYIIKHKVRLFEPTDPKNLLGFVREKEKALISILPQLEMTRKMAPKKNDAQIFEGAGAFMRILYNFLEYKKDILVYGIPDIAPEMLKTKIPHFHKERLKKKVAMKHIYNYNAQARISYLNKMPLTHAKYLPTEYDSQVSTNICGDEVVISVWSRPVTSIRIINPNVAESYRRYFNILWKAAR